jgi:hypothetical protein
MTRSELIQELHSVVYNERRNYRKFGDNTRKNITLDTYLSERIADFILSRERLLLEKIGNPLMEFKANTIAYYDKTYGCDPLEWGICDGEKAIDEALAIIEKESEQ